MDSSNSKNVRIVLGKFGVPLHELTLLEMAEIYFETIKRIKSQLRYVSGFEPIAKELNRWIGGQANRITQISPLFPDGKSEKTKASIVDIIEEAKGDSVTVRKVLFVTDEGELLLWTASYELQPASYGDKNEIATESRFELLDFKKFEGIQGQEFQWKKSPKELLLKALTQLQYTVSAVVAQREQYLSSMREAHQTLCFTLRRIQKPAHHISV